MPQLSIIVPIYNVEQYLPKCLESILGQTFTDFELILVDDGSPDRCGAIIDEYAQKDSRIIPIHQANQGVCAARNAGLKIARGRYIGFVDPDDWIEPDMYETLMEAITETGCDIATCSWVESYADGTEKPFDLGLATQVISGQEFLEHLFDMPATIGNMVWSRLYKKKLIRAYFDKQCKFGADDNMFNAQYCLDLPHGGAVVNRPLYHIFQREGSITRGNLGRLAYTLTVRRKIIEIMRAKNERAAMLAEKVFINWCVIYCEKLRASGTEYYQFAKNKYLSYFAEHPHVLLKNKTFPWKQKLYFYLYYLKLKYENARDKSS